MKKLILLSFIICACTQIATAQSEDPYLWLEEVDGQKALEFVDKQNKATFDKLSKEKDYQSIYTKSLAIYNSTERIVFPTLYDQLVYNFWQDKEHPRGIWRRTSKASYLAGNPVWETLLDIDAMSKTDNIKWVYKGAGGLYPKYNRFLVRLSKGGGDAVITREFDVTTKSFVENGFYMDEAKGGGGYWDENTLIVSTDFGNGTMTTSGYPNQVKLWKRGTQLKDAQLIFQGDTTDVSSSGFRFRDSDGTSYLMVNRAKTFYTRESFVWVDGKLVKLDIPDDSQITDLMQNQLILDLKSNWVVDGETFKQGSLVSLNFTSLIKGKKEIQPILEPDEFSSVSGTSSTKSKFLVNILTNVKNELYIYSFNNGKWDKQKVNAPDFGTITINATDEFSDQYFFTFANFLSPQTLHIADASENTLKPLKSLPAYFDAKQI